MASFSSRETSTDSRLGSSFGFFLGGGEPPPGGPNGCGAGAGAANGSPPPPRDRLDGLAQAHHVG
jgi:hypothetical protein